MHVFGIDIVSGAICFPLTYSISTIIVELYGFYMARTALLISMLCNLLLTLVFYLAIHALSANSWSNQAAFESVLSTSSQVFIGSMLALFFGEIVCGYLLAKLKETLPTINLFTRILLSSILGIFLDSSIFLLCIYYYSSNHHDFINMLSNVLFHKFSYEVLSSVMICQLIKLLRKYYPSVRYQPLSVRFIDKK